MNEVEEWRDVVGYEGVYSVSSTGRVRRDLASRGSVPGRILKPWVSGSGYHLVNLHSRDGGVTRCVHELVLLSFFGPRPLGYYGCHSDGNPNNNSVSNLRWDTPSSNNYDKVAHGRDHNASKDACVRGHEFHESNLYVRALTGHRACKACSNEASRARRKGEVFSLSMSNWYFERNYELFTEAKRARLAERELKELEKGEKDD